MASLMEGIWSNLFQFYKNETEGETFMLFLVFVFSLFRVWALRLVFTSDGVAVSVVVRRVERYDLVKIKPTGSEAGQWFCLCLRCLRSSENCIVGVASRSGRINLWQCSIKDFAIGWFSRFCFRLRQPSFHWIISDGVESVIRRNGNVLLLSTPIPSSLWLRLRLCFDFH